MVGPIGSIREKSKKPAANLEDMEKLSSKLYVKVDENMQNPESLHLLTANQLRWLCKYFGVPLASGKEKLKEKLEAYFRNKESSFLCQACRGRGNAHWFNNFCAFGPSEIASKLCSEPQAPVERDENLICFLANGDSRGPAIQFEIETMELDIQGENRLDELKELVAKALNPSNNYSMTIGQSDNFLQIFQRTGCSKMVKNCAKFL